jgi:hypothetical protein
MPKLETTTLYRPVGPQELELIKQRLPKQLLQVRLLDSSSQASLERKLAPQERNLYSARRKNGPSSGGATSNREFYAAPGGALQLFVLP